MWGRRRTWRRRWRSCWVGDAAESAAGGFRPRVARATRRQRGEVCDAAWASRRSRCRARAHSGTGWSIPMISAAAACFMPRSSMIWMISITSSDLTFSSSAFGKARKRSRKWKASPVSYCTHGSDCRGAECMAIFYSNGAMGRRVNGIGVGNSIWYSKTNGPGTARAAEASDEAVGDALASEPSGRRSAGRRERRQIAACGPIEGSIPSQGSGSRSWRSPPGRPGRAPPHPAHVERQPDVREATHPS